MKKRCNVAIVILAATAIVTVALERDAPRETDRQGHSFAKRIPLEIGQWEAEELPVAPAVVEMLDTDDVLMRSYKNGKAPVGDLPLAINVRRRSYRVAGAFR